uniref:phosphodiester glycosidase family protein n=1 Tax=uncultured Draconibacterium sp. TaxID=1573823 RepID=UPI003216EAE2
MLHRSIFSFLLLVSIISSTFAQGYTRIDSVSLQNGCRSIHIKEETNPLDIYIIEIDLLNKKNKLKTGLANDKIAWMKASGEAFVNKETVGHMIERRSNAGETVIGGINADFFNMANGMQFNVTATNGEIASTGITPKNHAALYTDEFGEPYIGLVNLVQTAVIPGIGQFEINGINIIRNANYLVLYNQFTGLDKSFANEWGVECLLEPLDSGLINGVRTYKIIEKAKNVTVKNKSQVILSGNGTARTFLDQTSAGQIIQINSTFIGLENKRITEMIGGWGHIVQKGENCAVSSIEVEGTMDHENDRHPRSAVGFNKDKSKLYFVAVDGRSDLSVGVNLTQLADFMIKELGVWEGLNFDGGGSTTLMSGNKTINNPSGGVQRAVCNALLVVEEESESHSYNYNFETQSNSSLEAGSKLYYETDATNRSAVWVLEVDRSEKNIHFSPIWANKEIGWEDAFGIAHKSEQGLSQMVADLEHTQDSVLIGAVNASPFNFKSNAVYGLTAVDGEITTLPDSGVVTPALWFNEKGEPFISNLSARLNVVASNGAQLALNEVNDVRWLDYLVLYNSFMGGTTNTNQWGAEVLIEPKEPLLLNGDQNFEVKEKVASQASGTGKMPMEEGQLVLSGNKKAYEFILNNIQVGQNVQISSEIQGANGQLVKHIVSGEGILMKDGELYDEASAETRTWQPVLGNDLRTAVGYSSDKSKVFLFVSDKFNENNLGLSLPGLTAIMEKYEVADGIVLGGGNSATLYAGEELVNVTSENEPLIPSALVVEFFYITGNSIIETDKDIRVYPNPSNGKVFIQASEDWGKNTEFKLYDPTGRVVVSREIGSQNKLSLDISGVENGIYFFTITDDEQKQKSGKLIINK